MAPASSTDLAIPEQKPNNATGQDSADPSAGADDNENVYVPMDADIGIYESTYDLDSRLADREFEKKDQTDYVTLADVEGEMDELKTDKFDETISADFKKTLESLVKRTVQ